MEPSVTGQVAAIEAALVSALAMLAYAALWAVVQAVTKVRRYTRK